MDKAETIRNLVIAASASVPVAGGTASVLSRYRNSQNFIRILKKYIRFKMETAERAGWYYLKNVCGKEYFRY